MSCPALLAEVLFRPMDLMLRLGAQPLGIFTKPPRPLNLTQMVPLGERGAATVTKRDVRIEREENVLVTGFLAALAEELPLQVFGCRALDVEEDVPVYLGQGRGPRRALAHYTQTTPKLLFRPRPLARLRPSRHAPPASGVLGGQPRSSGPLGRRIFPACVACGCAASEASHPQDHQDKADDAHRDPDPRDEKQEDDPYEDEGDCDSDHGTLRPRTPGKETSGEPPLGEEGNATAPSRWDSIPCIGGGVVQPASRTREAASASARPTAALVEGLQRSAAAAGPAALRHSQMLTISVQIGVAKIRPAQPIGPIRSTIPIRMLAQPSHFGRAR